MTEVEDVWAVVRERNGLRTRVKKLETENARLRAIVASYTEKAPLKAADSVERRPRRQRQSIPA